MECITFCIPGKEIFLGHTINQKISNNTRKLTDIPKNKKEKTKEKKNTKEIPDKEMNMYQINIVWFYFIDINLYPKNLKSRVNRFGRY